MIRRKDGRHKIKVMLAGSRAQKIVRRLADAVEVVSAEEKPRLVILPYADYQRLVEEAEDKAAERAYTRARGDERVSIEFVERLVAGESAIRLWREHRGMTLERLAKASRLSKGYLSDLERGKRAGPTGTLRKIAAALGVDLADLAE